MIRSRVILILAALGIAFGAGVIAFGQDTRGRQEVRTGNAPREDTKATRADADVLEEGGQKVKVFKFGGLDISGRLKSPQLLYFLNRLRAEFDRPRLPHRSFVPKVVESTKGKAF